MDAALLNSVANHPDVRGALGGEGAIDLAPAIDDPANIALVNEAGGFLVMRQGPALYEAHTLFLPEGRGDRAIAAMQQGMRYLFTETDCLELRTRIPGNNPAAAMFARVSGFREIFTRDRAWPVSGGEPVSISYQTQTFDNWRARDPLIAAFGHAFHEELEVAKQAAGSALDQHPDDPAHDRAVGASFLMIRAGNVRKGVATYNRWASLAGYANITLLSETPPILDVVDAIVTMRNGAMEVLKCR